MMESKIHKENGYIALMSTIIIGMVLLTMVAEEGFSGWHARFNVLGTESKEQSSALANGCADQTITNLVTDPFYVGDTDINFSGGKCHIFPIQFNNPSTGKVLIKVQTQVNNAYTNLDVVEDFNDVHIGANPLAGFAGTPNLNVTTVSRQEVAIP